MSDHTRTPPEVLPGKSLLEVLEYILSELDNLNTKIKKLLPAPGRSLAEAGGE